MTAPHPVPPLIAIAALGALFFTLLALWLPANVSMPELASGGSTSPATAHATGDRAASVQSTDNVFRQPITAPLPLFSR